MRRSSGWRDALAATALVLLATAVAVPDGTAASPAAASSSFVAGGSVEQVYVTELVPGEPVELLAPDGAVVGTAAADEQGAHLFRQVPPASGYRVRHGGVTGPSLTVLAPEDHPSPSFYDAVDLEEGYGYLPTRDGTLLSVNVHLPYGPGPFPAVVDYSGYDPSQPGDPPQDAAAFLIQGYAVIGVNMRGTGCSGGAFDYFETLQSLDGYDAIEAVAAQPWSNGDVGMVGISYPGISQLFVAATRPPHLRAITPLSVIADTYRSTLFPGGIRNEGFAVAWAADRQAAARPAARPWARDRIEGGDVICEGNQTLRLQSRDLLAEITPDRYYEAAGDALSPRAFVHRIQVPVYLSGQFQDEQTGGHFSTMVRDFTASPVVRVTLTNGTHVEPLGPDQLQALLEFVDIYVGRRTPSVSPILRFAAAAVYAELFGAPGLEIGPDRFAGWSPEAAQAAYEAEAPVRVLWENGAGRAPGEPVATAVSTHAGWPVPEAEPRRWWLDADGTLADASPTTPDDAARGVSTYAYDPAARPAATAVGEVDIWRDNGALGWTPLVDGTARSFVTAPFPAETALAGMGAVELWLRSTAADTDVEVVLSEVRPDGQERYIQSGWLRASHRTLDPARSTELEPLPTHLEVDAAPLPPAAFSEVRIPLFPFAHVVRPGSRLRLTVSAPGGNQPLWAFTSLDPDGDQVDALAHSIGRPSSLVLPVLPPSAAPDVPDTAPPCPSLRNQPCRPYAPERRAVGVVAADAGDGTLVVSWAPPEGGGATGYRVTVRPVGVDDVDAAAEGRVPGTEPLVVDVDGATTTRVTGVAVGATYTATVTVVDDGVEGLPSSVSLPATVGEPAPVTTPTSAPVGTVAPTTVPAAVAGGGELPRTGADARVPAVLGLALVGAGAAMAAVAGLTRRRPARR